MPASSTSRPLPWVTGRSRNSGMTRATVSSGPQDPQRADLAVRAEVAFEGRDQDDAVDDHRFGKGGH